MNPTRDVSSLAVHVDLSALGRESAHGAPIACRHRAAPAGRKRKSFARLEFLDTDTALS